MKKNKPQKDGIVYSTNSDFSYDLEDELEDSLGPKQQDLRIFLDRIKGGKFVTRITGFKMTDADITELSKLLKTKCGSGGSTKDGNILIQGDVRQKVKDVLDSQGFKSKLAGG